MRQITAHFLNQTTMSINDDVIKVFNFLSSPDSVSRMILATEKGKPALAGIVSELEQKYAKCKEFPLDYSGSDRNAKNRRNVGWMVKYIMKEYGYTPSAYLERTRIGSDSKSKYFSSATVYKKTINVPNYIINSQSFALCRNLKREEIFITADDADFEFVSEGIQSLKILRERLKIEFGFIAAFLEKIGYNGLLAESDIKKIFDGKITPCIEIYDTLVNILDLFVKFKCDRLGLDHEIMGVTTDKALRAFYASNIDPATVTDVYVFLYAFDAILFGFYNLKQNESKGNLVDLATPNLVIITENKKEYWFSGLTTGYGGTGCRGTEELLNALGIISAEKDTIRKEIRNNKVLEYHRVDQRWVSIGQDTSYDKLDSQADDHHRLCRQNEKLVLLISSTNKTEKGRIVEPSLSWLKQALFFLKKPSSIKLLPKEEAKKEGYMDSDLTGDRIYQIIITDNNEREIWLTYPFENIPMEKMENLSLFLSDLGVDKSIEKKPKIKNILFREQPQNTLYGTYMIDTKNRGTVYL